MLSDVKFFSVVNRQTFHHT